jgi:hypothetical protein
MVDIYDIANAKTTQCVRDYDESSLKKMQYRTYLITQQYTKAASVSVEVFVDLAWLILL